MSGRIPPLNPLHVFEVASRTGTFTAAAAELNVTQSAVSRQIATLESYLRVSLFRRDRHGISLTAQGEAYREQIAAAFALIASASRQLTEQNDAEPLRVRAYTTFAAKWFIPRLPKFHAMYAGIQIRLDSTVAAVDFSKDNVDLAIQLGRGDWRGVESEFLFRDVIQPVCSPQLLRCGSGLASIDGLKEHRLLYSRYRRKDWEDWLSAVGRLDLLADGMVFPSSVLTYQAAVESFGVAVGQIRLLEHDISSGLLIALFDAPVDRGLAYYACWPSNRPRSAHLRSFINWLTKEAAVYGDSALGRAAPLVAAS